jgi:Zn-finger nucleic acid-binding protein
VPGTQAPSATKWCEKCGGVFADLEASRRIVNTLDRALLEIGFQGSLGKERKEHESRTLTCPECLLEMVKGRIESANCEIDACPVHGTWFDTGELVDVIRAFAKARKQGVFVDRQRSIPTGVTTQQDLPTLVAPETGWADEGFRGVIRWLERF